MHDATSQTQLFQTPYLVVVKGKRIGSGYLLLDLPVSIGRREATIVPDPKDQSISRLHASILQDEGTLWIVDNGSTNGTLVNGNPIKRHALKAGDRIEIGGTELAFIRPMVEADADPLYHRAYLDKLTKAFNRTRFRQKLAQAYAEAELFSSPFGLLFITIDQFEEAEKEHGVEFTDRLLIELAELLSSLLLEDQELYRYENNMFAVLLHGPSARFAMDVGEMVRQAVEVFTFTFRRKSATFTVSTGIGYVEKKPKKAKDAMAIVALAEKCRNEAEAADGNKVVGERAT
jgi:diguanylate cyclase (GGDEF)-like protein